jgi:hypothetical protein
MSCEFGRISWTVTASNAATAAENKPVYIFYVIRKSMGGMVKTYEDKQSFGVTFPTFCHLHVLFLGNIEIHREQGSRTVGRVGLAMLCCIRRNQGDIWRVAVAIYSWYERGCSLANIRCVPGPGSTRAPCSRSGSLGFEDIEGEGGGILGRRALGKSLKRVL